ncbi:MAG: hypothetical protein LBR60_00485, partial [Fibrobacter sp.]|nr:hypothetical protein [Fibrobacter sp.]
MNKKLLTGIFGFGISVLLFVACGSGDIVPTTSDDTAEFLEKQEEYSDQSKRDQIIEACLLDPECDDELMNPSSAVEPSSSSTIPPLESSSSAATPVSSSSGTTQPNSSSAVTPVSSSSGTTQPGSSSSTQTGGVTCAPTPLTISKGGEATWKVEGLGGAALTTHFDWSFPDGNPATVTGGATTAFSPKVTYGTSGSKTATLTYNYDNVITCSPLQVNGAPITGSCTANSLQVDVALGETITYTMTAASTGAKITGYTWTKAAGTSNTA